MEDNEYDYDYENYLCEIEIISVLEKHPTNTNYPEYEFEMKFYKNSIDYDFTLKFKVCSYYRSYYSADIKYVQVYCDNYKKKYYDIFVKYKTKIFLLLQNVCFLTIFEEYEQELYNSMLDALLKIN